MTLVECPEAYELYKTKSLASDRNTLVNYGKQTKIYGVHKNHETNKDDRLTFLEVPKDIKEVSLNFNNVTK